MKVENLDQQETWGVGGILSTGDHLCICDSAEEGTTSRDNPQIEMKWRAIAGPQNGDSITDWLVVLPQTYGKVKQMLEAVGITVQGGDWDIPVSSIVGRKAYVVVRQEADQSDATKMRDRVQGYRSAGQAGSDVPADTSDFSTAGAPGGNEFPF